jgi:hypothetical protein
MNRLLDIVGNQAVWFVAVVGAGRGLAWPGVAAAAAFTAWHLSTAAPASRAWRMVLAAVAVGLLFDGSLARLGWVRYAAPADGAWAALGAPAWILALWVAFALTLTRSLAALQQRLALAALVGAIGGPLAFLGAARGWNAVEFAEPAARALAALAVGWAFALPALAVLARPAAIGVRAEGAR